MKIIATIMLLVCMAFLSTNATALPPKEVTLTVSSDGANKEEAIKNALRSAIEQTYGTLVSSNTSLLNDEVVKDEIVTVSTGNIKKYQEVISEILPSGRVYVTLQATVSLSNLVTYAESKGATVEFDGASFARNIQMEELNAKSQDKVLKNLEIQTKSLLQNGYDYSLEGPEIRKVKEDEMEYYQLDFKVTASPNENFKNAIKLILETLECLHVPEKKRVKTVEYGEIILYEQYTDWKRQANMKGGRYYLRKTPYLQEWVTSLWYNVYLGITNYTIHDGTGMHSVTYINDPRWYPDYPSRDKSKYPIENNYKEYFLKNTTKRKYFGEYYRYASRHPNRTDISNMLQPIWFYLGSPDDLFGAVIAENWIKVYRQKQFEKIYVMVESIAHLHRYKEFTIQRKEERM